MDKVGYVEFVGLAEKYATDWFLKNVKDYVCVSVELSMCDSLVYGYCILDDGNTIRQSFTIPSIEETFNVIFTPYH